MPDLESQQRRFAEALQEIIKQWPTDDPEDRDDTFRRVASTGAIELVRSAINHPALSNESVSLWASDRPDLSYEALVLRDAWKELFSEDERALAATRLAQARSSWENRPERQAKTWRDTWVFWIDGKPIGATRHGPENAERPFPACDMFARMAKSLEESGQFGASFSQRRHYRNCPSCSAFASLDEIVTPLDGEEFRRLRVLLSMLPERLNKPVLELWIFVLLNYIDQTFEVNPEDWIAARQGLADGALCHFVQSLDTFEFFGLPLAKRVARVFQPAIPGYGELVLPAELGFPPEPGVLNTSISIEEWTRLQQAEDEVGWGQKPGTGLFDDERFDAFDFMFLLIEATSFQITHWWKGDRPEVLTPSYLPDVDTLSEEPEHDELHADTSPIQLAEASLRVALGDEICDGLSRDANAWVDAVEAERRYNDPDLREGHGIVFHLVRAFRAPAEAGRHTTFRGSSQVSGGARVSLAHIQAAHEGLRFVPRGNREVLRDESDA